MEPNHSLLRRQLKRHFGHVSVPEGQWAAFVAAVEAAYQASDQDREMLELSLDLSSQELLQANAEMQLLLGAIPDLLLHVDDHGFILHVKTSATDQFAMRPAEMAGRPLAEVPFPEAGAKLLEALGKTRATGTMAECEFAVTRRGRAEFFEARVTPLADGGGIMLVRNITQRREAEAALRASEERFRMVAVATRDAVYDWDGRTDRVWRNETYRVLFSGAATETTESSGWWSGNIHPDDRERVTGSLEAAFAGGNKLWSMEYRFRRVDGSYAFVLDHGYLLYDEAGRAVRMIGAMTDLTERKRLEEQFLQSQKMDAIGQLAGGVAHDFNNLLTVILGNLSMLQVGTCTPAETRAAAEQAFAAGQRAAELTRQLLTFSRREPLNVRLVELNAIVADMSKMFRRLVDAPIAVETSLAPGQLPLLADVGMIEQMLMNLVVNSRDAMPRGGRLKIETSWCDFAEQDAGQNRLRRAGRFVRLRVADTGTGIAPELLGRIFEPFFTTKEAGKGTGLGLATVFGIVQQHQGWIEVDSAPGNGTEFVIFLPWASGSTKSNSASPMRRSLPAGKNELVLIVEDEAHVRGWMRLALERFGYRVQEAGSGPEALAWVESHAPRLDLLISDMVMPGGLSGRELAERLWQRQPELRVLICSGYHDRMKGIPSDAGRRLGFLPKPLDAEALLHRVRETLDAS